MPIKALLVEDNPTDARIIAELLMQAGGRHVSWRYVNRLSAALERLAAERPDLVILDLSLPDSRGLATFRHLHARNEDLPIVVLTGLNDVDLAVQAIGEGASDYLVKDDLSGGLLVRALYYAIERSRVQQELRQTQRELELRNRLAEILLTAPDSQMFEQALAVLLEAAGSRHGALAYIDGDGAAVFAATAPAKDHEAAPGISARFPRENWSGVWGRSLVERQPVCSNQPERAPERHIPIRRVLAVPLLDGDEVIGLLETANKPNDYDERDIAFLERVAAYLAPVLHARLQRDAHEKALAGALAAKEVLLREVHHRVKNNLQIISSLLNMQAETLPESLQSILEVGQRRVRSMALVHEQLYSVGQPDHLDFAEYAAALANDLMASQSADCRGIRLRTELESVMLPADQAVPCGLILNELLTNSLKYAYPNGRAGEIVVGLSRSESRVTLRVADDGIGLPPGFDWEQAQSLGLRIVHILTAQLNGTMRYKPGQGARFTLTFPAAA